ncbi:MAG: type II secretion system protein GspM [Neptuniibacter sp.]
MNKTWQSWSARWDELSKRERGLLLITAIAVPIVLIYVLLIEKPLQSLQSTPKQMAAIEKELKHQQRLLEFLESKEVKDPNVAARAELKSLRQKLKEANEDVRQAAGNLVSPQKMLTLLRSVLENEQGTELISARSLPVQNVQLGHTAQTEDDEVASEENSNAATAVIYMHPFEIELQGNYQGVYDYLRKVEQLDGVFFWDLLEYGVEEYPNAKVRIQIHTLSYEEGWLGA